jgi:hypothetical protein
MSTPSNVGGTVGFFARKASDSGVGILTVEGRIELGCRRHKHSPAIEEQIGGPTPRAFLVVLMELRERCKRQGRNGRKWMFRNVILVCLPTTLPTGRNLCRFNRSQRYQALCQDSIVSSQTPIQIRHSCLIEPNSFMTDLLITFRIIRSTNTFLWKLYPLPRPHARQPPAKLRYLSWRQRQPPRCLLLLLIHPYHSHLHLHILEQRGRRRRRQY